jgi:hypothetical protein
VSDLSPADVVIDASTGLIAVVLVISGIAKLPATDRTLAAMAGLRVPKILQRRAVACALPILELGIALALLVAPGVARFTAALAAVAMLLVFTVLVARAVRAGDEISCECFGALSRDVVDGTTVVRNLVLLAAAVAAALVGPDDQSFVLSLTTLAAAELAALVILWIAMVAIALLARQNLDLRAELRRVDATPRSDDDASAQVVDADTSTTGRPIPDAELVNSVGVSLPLTRLDRGRAVLLLFVKAGCGSCAPVARAFPEWEARIGANVTIRIATSSRPDDIAEHYPEYGDRVRFGARGARAALGVRMLPSAVLLGSDGTVASDVAEGFDEISALVDGIEDAMRSLPEAQS